VAEVTNGVKQALVQAQEEHASVLEEHKSALIRMREMQKEVSERQLEAVGANAAHPAVHHQPSSANVEYGAAAFGIDVEHNHHAEHVSQHAPAMHRPSVAAAKTCLHSRVFQTQDIRSKMCVETSVAILIVTDAAAAHGPPYHQPTLPDDGYGAAAFGIDVEHIHYGEHNSYHAPAMHRPSVAAAKADRCTQMLHSQPMPPRVSTEASIASLIAMDADAAHQPLYHRPSCAVGEYGAVAFGLDTGLVHYTEHNSHHLAIHRPAAQFMIICGSSHDKFEESFTK
jgi:hypothetical protein